jgi:hypothetical protein
LHRYTSSTQHADQNTLDLFSEITQFNPSDRIDINSVTSHAFFDDIRPPAAREAARLSLVAVLRGNHGIRNREAKALMRYDV